MTSHDKVAGCWPRVAGSALAMLSSLLFSTSVFGIEVTLKGTKGGKTEGFGTEAEVKAYGNVDANAYGTPKNDRDPDEGKRKISDGAINASVPDFTVTKPKGTGTAGGHAKLEQKSIWGNKFGKGELRARADQTGDGTADSLSTVSTDPDGFFSALDGDSLYNDALVLFLIEPESGLPIFNHPGEDRWASFAMEVSVSGAFFDGQVYDVDASVTGADTVASGAAVAPDWQIFLVDDMSAPSILESADFDSTGLTDLEFESAFSDYISTPVGSGFGGATDFFGAWFVRRDIDAGLLTDWTWDSSLQGMAAAVPGPATLSLIALTGVLGIWRRR